MQGSAASVRMPSIDSELQFEKRENKRSEQR